MLTRQQGRERLQSKRKIIITILVFVIFLFPFLSLIRYDNLNLFITTFIFNTSLISLCLTVVCLYLVHWLQSIRRTEWRLPFIAICLILLCIDFYFTYVYFNIFDNKIHFSFYLQQILGPVNFNESLSSLWDDLGKFHSLYLIPLGSYTIYFTINIWIFKYRNKFSFYIRIFLWLLYCICLVLIYRNNLSSSTSDKISSFSPVVIGLLPLCAAVSLFLSFLNLLISEPALRHVLKASSFVLFSIFSSIIMVVPKV